MVRLLTALFVAAVCVPAIAQNPDALQKPVSLTATSAPLRDTLKLLFKQMGVSYTLAPTVSGTVDVELKDVSAQTALNALLRSADRPLRFVVRDGVFAVEEKPADQPVVSNPEPTPSAPPTSTPKGYRVIELKHVDGFTIGEMLRQTGHNVTLLHQFPLGVAFSPFPGLLNGVGQGMMMGGGLLGGAMGLLAGELVIGAGAI